MTPDEPRPVITLKSSIELPTPIPYEAGRDDVSTFQNIHSDQWIFIRRPDQDRRLLYGNDIG